MRLPRNYSTTIWPVTPTLDRNADERLALFNHGLAVLIPVRVLTGDGTEVFHEGFYGVRKVNDLGLTVDLHPGIVKFITQRAK